MELGLKIMPSVKLQACFLRIADLQYWIFRKLAPNL